jgi:hypothetical protein
MVHHTALLGRSGELLKRSLKETASFAAFHANLLGYNSRGGSSRVLYPGLALDTFLRDINDIRGLYPLVDPRLRSVYSNGCCLIIDN